METIISQLFCARDIAHKLHLKTRSFAAHMALGDLYDALVEHADDLAEIHQGKYGIMDIPCAEEGFTDHDAVSFIKELALWAENSRGLISQNDTNILNEWDNVLTTIYRAKYKLENLA